MAVTTDDLFQLEAMVRLHADGIRKAWPRVPADMPGVQAHASNERAEAARFDRVGDLLKGLQGCWLTGGAEIVRDGFKREARAYDLSKTYTLAVAEDARETAIQPDEAAA